jgi:hypothetical protein
LILPGEIFNKKLKALTDPGFIATERLSTESSELQPYFFPMPIQVKNFEA